MVSRGFHWRAGLAGVLAGFLTVGLLAAAQAAPTLVNGGFEDGLNGWTVVNQVGGEGSFFSQSGTGSPLNGDPVPAPTQGVSAAMTDGFGPGSHVLYQDFFVPAGPGILYFDIYIGNRADRFARPNSLAFDITNPVGAQTLNQQARVDIMLASADPFSLDAGDILANVYATLVGDPLESGYTRINADLSAIFAANAGQTLRLRFAEVDNLAPLQVGIDNVSFVPVPGALWLVLLALTAALLPRAGRADTTPLTMLDPNLEVSTVLSAGLVQPMGIVFLGSTEDYLVIEKASGRVKRVTGGVIQPVPVLDLAVNSNSERGALSMALHPAFPEVPHVFIYWTESSTGADSNVVGETPLLGNRVDRFIWNGSTLVQDLNVVRLRSRQTDNVVVPGQPLTSRNNNENGNHNGGTIRFGPDGKLYVFIGDVGRRGWMQNLANGPFTRAPFVDDTFGGPAPDNAHLSGVMLRLNADGTTPTDNPFFMAGAAMGGEVGANVQKIYSYGHRNGFGMAFDPVGGFLWLTENADDAYAELNRLVPGMNGGWIQFAGPAARMPDWKFIETTQFGLATQQVRYPPTRAAYNTSAALSRLVMLPGAVYKDPELSWRYETGPAGTTFVVGNALGAEYNGTLWIGSARAFQQVGANGGSLYRIKLTADRLAVDTSADPRLADKVADNLFRAQKFEGTESETMVIGRGFGTTPSIEQGPDGNLYVVSVTDGAIYRISRRVVPQ